MNSGRVVHLLCCAILGAAWLASCRDYGNGNVGMGSEGAGAGAGADSLGGQYGRSPPVAGDAGAAVEIVAGGSGSETGGVGGLPEPGGAGGAPPPTADTGTMGAVRLLNNGRAICGGTLLNNSWVLTADSCIPGPGVAGDGVNESADPNLRVAYGADSSTPDQIESVREVARFPGNDGSPETRGRDLVLLNLENPIRVRGTTVGFYQPVLNMPAAAPQLAGETCVGWDLSIATDENRDEIKIAEFTPFAVDLNVNIGARNVGDMIWWTRQSPPGTDDVALPTNADIGIGCFQSSNGLDILASVNLGIPERRRDGRDNSNIESRSIGVAQDAIRAWLEQTMMADPDYLPLPALGPVMAAWSTPQTLNLLGVSKASGNLLWFQKNSGVWAEGIDLGAPEGSPLATDLRPAGIWRDAGSIELFAVDNAGRLWWKRRQDQTIWKEWESVDVVTTAITSGVRVAERLEGHFHLVARGDSGELRHAEYEDGFWVDTWQNFGDTLLGEPTIDMPGEERINIFYTRADGTTQQRYYIAGAWALAAVSGNGTINSAPASAHWSLMLFDMVGRSATGTLARRDYRGGWFGLGWLDTGAPMPADTDPYVALRYAGHGDIFVSTSSGEVWHVQWPRSP